MPLAVGRPQAATGSATSPSGNFKWPHRASATGSGMAPRVHTTCQCDAMCMCVCMIIIRVGSPKGRHNATNRLRQQFAAANFEGMAVFVPAS